MDIITNAERSTLDLFGAIGGSWLDDFDEREVADQLNALPAGNALTVRVNSPGGSVFAALAIKRLLEARAAIAPVAIEVVGIAASAATIITCASGVPVRMAEGSTMLIHPVRLASDAARTPEELREAAEGLEKIRLGIRDIYRSRTGQTDAELDALMGKESYLTADEAVALHFADSKITDAPEVEAATPDRVCAKAGETCAADLDRIRAAVGAFAPVSAEPQAEQIAEPAETPKGEEKAEDAQASTEPEIVESRASAEPQDTAAEHVRAAIAAERARISAIDELAVGLRGCDDIIRGAKTDGMSPGDFAIAALKRLKTFPAVALGARIADAAPVGDLASEGNSGVIDQLASQQTAEDAEELKNIIAAGKRGFGGK